VIAIVIAAIAGVCLAYRPWKAYLREKSESQLSMEKMHQAEKQRTELAIQKASLDSSVGREAKARDRGYLKKGEEALQLQTKSN